NHLQRSHRQARYGAGGYARSGRYQVQRLIKERGRDAKVIDWLDEITADCPKKSARNMNDQRGALCPDLPRMSPALPPKADIGMITTVHGRKRLHAARLPLFP